MCLTGLRGVRCPPYANWGGRTRRSLAPVTREWVWVTVRGPAAACGGCSCPVSRVSGPVCLLVCVVGSGGGLALSFSSLVTAPILASPLRRHKGVRLSAGRTRLATEPARRLAATCLGPRQHHQIRARKKCLHVAAASFLPMSRMRAHGQQVGHSSRERESRRCGLRVKQPTSSIIFLSGVACRFLCCCRIAALAHAAATFGAQAASTVDAHSFACQKSQS